MGEDATVRDGERATRDPGALRELPARVPPEAHELAAQGRRAAARAGGDFGYLGGLGDMRAEPTADGGAVVTMAVTPNVPNRYGHVHGGMLFTLADYAMGAAARSLVEAGQGTVTLEAKVNYLANCGAGRSPRAAPPCTGART